jgi:hypothetical protein
MRRATRPSVTIGFPARPVSPPDPVVDEIMYKGYRIEPESYYVTNTTWSPRAVVSLKTDDGWSRQTPLYSTRTTRFPTRDEADRCALDVARAWIDTAVERPRG